MDIDRDTVWRDVFDALTPAEQACVSDAAGTELDRVLRQGILDEDQLSQPQLALLPCLPPQVVRAVFLAGMAFGMEDDGIQVGEEQEDCLREVVDEMDVTALIAVLTSDSGASDEAAQAEDAAQLFEMMAGLLRCLPELFDAGVGGPDDFADGAASAVRLVVGEAAEGVLENEGDVDYFVFEAVEGEVYEVEVDLGTLGDSVVAIADADGFQLDYNDDRGDDSYGSRLVWRASMTGDFYVEVSGFGGGFGSTGSYTLRVVALDVEDDHGDGVDGASEMVLGESVEGVLDYEGDVDYFVFEAVEGEVYEVDVDLGTLSDSVVAVVDSHGWEVAWNDDRGDEDLGSGLAWRAPQSGDFFVEVSGYGEGSYMLAVVVSDIVDDYADGVDGATEAALGESVEGVLEYADDVDVFVFGAAEDVLYEVDVELGSLSDSAVAVYDADGVWLGSNDDRGEGSFASRLVFRAPVSGDLYVEVSGYGEGSYTLTVRESDITDDHSNLSEGATAVEVGRSAAGVLDYPDDVDVFVFGALEGTLYEIAVTLGTLSDSVLAVYDSDGFEWAWDDDYEGSLASRVEWRAPLTGDFYVEVSGYGEGSYTLAVEVSE
ncbi:MAG: hypothetical protein OXI56_12185 [bacterium]|nr:hypothetical protein [bacterium]MDE0602544.1 hypothetical protein [bacterium]